MSDLNKVIISGRVTRDPELQYTPSGTAICNLGVAVGKQWKDPGTGEKKESVAFVDVAMFKGTAEFAAKYCFKGQRVIVSGSLRQEQWEDKATGQKRTRMSVLCEDLNPIDWPDRDGNQSQGQGNPPPRAANPAPHTSRPVQNEPLDDDDVPF